MLNGEFRQNIPSHTHYLKQDESRYVKYLNRINYGNMHKFKLSRDNRN